MSEDRAKTISGPSSFGFVCRIIWKMFLKEAISLGVGLNNNSNIFIINFLFQRSLLVGPLIQIAMNIKNFNGAFNNYVTPKFVHFDHPFTYPL